MLKITKVNVLESTFPHPQALFELSTLTQPLTEGVACAGPEPLSLERLQQTYTAGERRAIYDAVVTAAPFCHDLADLALASSTDGRQTSKVKSRMEILAELRDMKRRRAKYRVAAKTTNYSDMLRDVIKTQMELYAETKGIVIKTEYGSKTYVSLNMATETSHAENKPTNIVIKQERVSPEGDDFSVGSRRHRERSISRDRRHDTYRRRNDDREREPKKRRNYYDDKDYCLEKTRYGNGSNQGRDKYSSKERRQYDDGQSKREEYIRNKEDVHTSEDRIKSDKLIHFSRSKDSQRHAEEHRKHDSQRHAEEHRKHDRHYGHGSSKNKQKYECSFRENEKRDKSYKEYSSKDNKYDDYYSKHDEYPKSYKDAERHREQKHKRYFVEMKEEKDIDYDDYTNERKKRKRHS